MWTPGYITSEPENENYGKNSREKPNKTRKTNLTREMNVFESGNDKIWSENQEIFKIIITGDREVEKI